MLVAAITALAFLASGCDTVHATIAEQHGDPVPWCCDPVAQNGNTDWWHIHPTLCANKVTGTAFAVNTTDTGCANQGGINLHTQNYSMLHVRAVDNLEYHADVHAPMHPCRGRARSST